MTGRAAALPSMARLEGLLVSTADAEALTRLRSFAAAHEDVARHCRLAYEEFARLAVFRLRVERKLGATLMLVVRRGGHRPRSTGLTNADDGRLPPGVTKQMAAKYRQLARIDEAVFDAYLRHVVDLRCPPSANGARAFAAARGTAPGPAAARRHPPLPPLPPAVLDAVHRFLGRVDVTVARDAAGPAGAAATALQLRTLRGRVLVAGCRDPGFWLPRLAMTRLQGATTEVVVALPAATGERWFRHLGDSDWSTCFVTASPPLLVAYHGPRRSLFGLAFRSLGTVLRPGDA